MLWIKLQLHNYHYHYNYNYIITLHYNSSISTAPIFQLTLVRKPNPFLRLIALLQLQVLPWPWSGSGHLYWFFHYDDALESPFCGFDFIVCTNVGSNRWNLNFQILMKLFSKIRCELLNYNYNYNSRMIFEPII